MLEQIKKLAGHSVLYGLGLVGSSIASMLLIPIFLHQLGRSEYGMQEVLSVFSSMLSNFLMLGLATILIKSYVTDCKTEDERKQLISSIVIIMSVMAVLVFILSSIFAGQLSEVLFADRRSDFLVRLAAISGGMLLVQSMIMFFLRAKQWAVKFAVISLVQLAVMVTLNIYLVCVRHLGVTGIQLATVVSIGISLIIGLLTIRGDLVPCVSGRMIRHVMCLALPLFPSSVAPWVLNVSDRYFLTHYMGLSDTGLYAAGYKVGMLGITTLVSAFQMAWGPYFYNIGGKQDTPRVCAGIMKLYILVICASGLVVSLFAPEILRVIGRREYWGAWWIVPYVGLAYIFYGAQFFTIPIFIRANQGKMLSLVMGGSAIANVAMNFVLIPRYGMRGAIVSTSISFLVQAVLSYWAANRFYPVRYEYGNLIKVLVLAVVVYLGVTWLRIAPVPPYMLKLVGIPVFGALLVLCRFFSEHEMHSIRNVISKRIRLIPTKNPL